MESLCRLEGFGSGTVLDIQTDRGYGTNLLGDLEAGTCLLTGASCDRFVRVHAVLHGEGVLYSLGFSDGTSLSVSKGQLLRRRVGDFLEWVPVSALAIGDLVVKFGGLFVSLVSFELLGEGDTYNVVMGFSHTKFAEWVLGHTFYPSGVCSLDYTLMDRVGGSGLSDLYDFEGSGLERVLCSAIRCKVPRDSGGLHGDIYSCELGYRHSDIIARFRGELSEDPDAQGFFTSRGRFVSREEAAGLCNVSGQVFRKDMKALFSEDLY